MIATTVFMRSLVGAIAVILSLTTSVYGQDTLASSRMDEVSSESPSYKVYSEGGTEDTKEKVVLPFKTGEFFKFRIHYGFVNAGYATLEIKDDPEHPDKGFYIKGYGTTTGLSRFFFKVEDYYETKMDKQTMLPYQFIRNIDEGGHTKDKIIDFDQTARKAFVNDRKYNKKRVIATTGDVQDMVSTFYYLRHTVDTSTLVEGDETDVTMFFDEKNYPFKLRFLGRDVIRTKFGKMNALKFRPLVLAGRVFKEEESLTVWVSDDSNKIPLRIQASLAVGSIKADLDSYRGLQAPLIPLPKNRRKN